MTKQTIILASVLLIIFILSIGGIAQAHSSIFVDHDSRYESRTVMGKYQDQPRINFLNEPASINRNSFCMGD